MCLELSLPTERFHFLLQFHFVNVIYSVVFNDAKLAESLNKTMFLEKLQVIEATYTATEHKLRTKDKSVLGNSIGTNLYCECLQPVRKWLGQITFLYKLNRETIFTVLLLRGKLTIVDNFNEKLRLPLTPLQL